MGGFRYFDFNTLEFTDFDSLFPEWEEGQERLLVLSPHDDDALLGAGYAILAAKAHGAKVTVVICCRGNAGYSDPSEKETIVEVRRKETLEAYQYLGISGEDVVRLDYDDFDLAAFVGAKSDSSGTLDHLIPLMRERKITRVLLPNPHKEHADHTAAFLSGLTAVPQAGDDVYADRGTPYKVKSSCIYSVWADFDGEPGLLDGRKPGLRADRAIIASSEIETDIRESLEYYSSQEKIIEDLIMQREKRRCAMGYVELYLRVDTRPKLNYSPYIEAIEGSIN